MLPVLERRSVPKSSRVNPFLGKEQLFMKAGRALLCLVEALPRPLRRQDKRRLRQVTGMLYAGLVWKRFNREGPLPFEIPQWAKEAHDILANVAKTREQWQNIADAVTAINATILDQQPQGVALARAVQICSAVSQCLVDERYPRAISSALE